MPAHRCRCRSRRARVLVVGLLALLALVVGCAESGTPTPTPARPTPIGDLDTGRMVVPRIAFCDLVPPGAVEDALAGAVAETEEWGNGEPAAPATGTAGDVSQEFGCSWRGGDGVVARAWVFSRPVTAGFARHVVRQTSRKQGCRSPAAPAFGRPSQLQVCTLGDGVLRVRHAGLFGDAWLTCELATTKPDPGLAGRWCVAVAAAAAKPVR